MACFRPAGLAAASVAVVLVLLYVDVTHGTGQFYGGSISYVTVWNNATAKWDVELDLITGWKLGTGPCGPGCSASSVGIDTRAVRDSVIAFTGNPTYFGNWISEIISNQRLHTHPLDTYINQHYTENVIAVSETGGWAQTRLQVTIPLEDPLEDHLEYITFGGREWRNLTVQDQQPKWHLQVRMDARIRNDTMLPNRSPQVLTRPMYRVKLNEITKIQITATDQDDDNVRCTMSQFVEAGHIGIVKIPGVTIDETTCTVTIAAYQYNNYMDDFWGAVAITARDLSKEVIYLEHERVMPGVFGMSRTPVQFLVHVLANLSQPEFVPPTPDHNHEFLLYADTIWSTELYARAPANTSIDGFGATGRKQEMIQISRLHNHPSDPDVKYVVVSWRPTTADIGRNIICTSAADSTGVETPTDRCFLIRVIADAFTDTSHVTYGQPYFIDIPTDPVLSCDVNVTCVFPVYVHAETGARITGISAPTSFIDKVHISRVTAAPGKGPGVYKADISIFYTMYGIKKMCLRAVDSNGKQSNETCIESDIKAINPCSLYPCTNSGICERNPADQEDFICHCIHGTRGRICEHQIDMCNPNPCMHARNSKCYKLHGGFFCWCINGYAGKTCETDIDECITNKNPCGDGGMCTDAVNGYVCNCVPRYNGTNCEIDLCSNVTPANSTTCFTGSIENPQQIVVG